MFIGVILNPRARKNRRATGDQQGELARALGSFGEVIRTESLDELGDAVRALLPRATHLVADGGDGALHWLVNEVRAQQPDRSKWPAMVPTNGGTIDFVARKAGVGGSAQGILQLLAQHAAAVNPPREVEVDSMLLTGEYADGRKFDRLGFALAAGGIGLRFFDKYYAYEDPSAAQIVSVITRAVASFAVRGSYAADIFRPTKAIVTIDGEQVPTQTHGAIHAGAFDVNLGGVLRVFPLATHGALHLQAGAIQPLDMIRALPDLARGRPLSTPRLWERPGREMIIEAIDEPLAPIIDGERFEGLTRLEVRPGPRLRIARVRA